MRATLKTLADDWNRHKITDKRPLIALWTYRFGRYVWGIKFTPLRKVLGVIYLLLHPIADLIGGVYLDRATKLGDKPHFIHAGNTQLHPGSVVGDNVGIMHGVTLGLSPSQEGAPVIGDNVFLGVNCTVLGNVTVGNDVTIAANSLVVSNVPDNSMVIGVPGKIMPKGIFSKNDNKT